MAETARMNAQLAFQTAQRVTDVVVEAVAVPVDGVVLHGSLASGAYEPQRSDIDLLCITSEVLSAASKHAVFDAVSQTLEPCPTAIDLRVTSRNVAAAPSRTPVIDLEIAAHPPDNVLEVVNLGATDTDLLNELAVCRAYGRALYGRAADEMIAPVPRRWLLEIADEGLSRWQIVHSSGPVGLIVPLTACRMWRYADEGGFYSKHDAARWVLERAPEHRVVREALFAHEGSQAWDTDAIELRSLLQEARNAVAAARSLEP
jgi:predicted nucleotidyltransferase